MTKISKSKHITKHGIVKKNPRKRVKIDYDFIVDEIFLRLNGMARLQGSDTVWLHIQAWNSIGKLWNTELKH